MQSEQPLTPALSPSNGEREEFRSPLCDSLNNVRARNIGKRFPLSIRWGEGQGEGPRRLHGYG